ncbi:hypothetical protein CTZ27_15155 [Streptomyces griseocarneus]|nr:hypothetical protein CTZ27_15155 [Streptomyces griseocarneus]
MVSSKQSAQKSTRKGPRTPVPAAPAAEPAAGLRPRRIVWAAALCGLEGLALLIGGVYLLIMGVLGKPQSPQQAEMLAVTVLVLAVLPLAAARGLWQLKRWSRGPAMATQIMALPVAWTLWNGGGVLIAAGAALAVAAVVGLGLVVNPTATEALGIGPREG